MIRSFLQASDQPGSRYVVGLAMIDFLCSILVPFLNIGLITYDSRFWPFGKLGCFVLMPLSSALIYASGWMLVAISLERVR